MIVEGNLLKMNAELKKTVQYSITLGGKLIDLNKCIDTEITLKFNGKINCINCGKVTKKTYNQGFCYNCLQTAPQADESVIKPELSKAQWGIARNMEWAEKHDLIDHYVYLSITSGLKVGVTRYHQIPTRWIDQGAVKAIRLAKTPNRHIAGVIENFLKKHLADKTNWRAMLKGEVDEKIDLKKEKNRAGKLLHNELKQYITNDDEVTEITYPSLAIPDKISSITFDKQNEIKAKLKGIKGQYLIFEKGKVLNIRKHNGYHVKLETLE